MRMRQARLAVRHDGDDGQESLKIGQLARRAAVSVDAIRFYERRGILPRAERRPSGYRVYRRADVERVRMTKALQKLGFTLDEVISALAAFEAGTATCASERGRLQTVIQRIDAKVAELSRLRAAVVQAFESCRAGRCPVLPPLQKGGGAAAPRRRRRPVARLGRS